MEPAIQIVFVRQFLSGIVISQKYTSDSVKYVIFHKKVICSTKGGQI